MNPLTNMKNVQKLSERELYTKNKTSWHDQYRNSAWLFIGGLPFDLTEGDIICIFSQYGEIVNINLIRDKDTGKSKGFCFLCYEDQRSTDLAVDNFNGIKILGRIIRVDHVNEYKIPKQGKKTDEETKKLYDEGCAPKPQPIQPPIKVKPTAESFDYRETLSDQIKAEIKLPQRLPIYPVKQEKVEEPETKKEKKHKKEKRKKKKKKRKKSDSDSSEENENERKKKKKKRKKSVSSDSSDNKGTKKSADSSEDSDKDKRSGKRKAPESGSEKNKRMETEIELPSDKRRKTEPEKKNETGKESEKRREPENKRQENKSEPNNYRYYDRSRRTSPGPYQRKKWYNY